MKINEEIYDNLYEFIRNLEIQIQKNIFKSNHTEQLRNFSNELFQLCKITNLNILLSDITSLSSYEELILTTPNQSRSYISISIENFYNEIIEPSNIEYYG